MRIASVRVWSRLRPVVGGSYVIAGSTVSCLDSTLVEVTTDDGLVGWGETCPVGPTYQPHHAAGARAALAELAPGLLGADPGHPLLLRRRMDATLAGHRYAKAALDIAAHDLLGKHHGVRVADLLGGPATERVPSYYATGVGEPDDVAAVAADRVARGYPRLQVKIGGRDVAVDIEVVRKVWEAVGGRVRLAVDGNRSLTTADAVTLSRSCADVPFVLEQPCDTLDEIRSLRGRVAHPVFVDESGTDLATVVGLVGRREVDGFGMKVTRIGGLQAMAAFRDVCEAASVPHTCDDAWGGDVVAAACVHVAATVSPRLLEGVWVAQPYIAEHDDPEHGLEVQDGHLRLPSGPGLGVVPDTARLGAPVLEVG
ncbi:mandelate racemase/muconate lactonizing enzyme family protein [Phycicoccus flavus]|uniref:mandelate racemase/muconate lactonizing enzyme family protein n=1 Tax=Phycicoccus flavus TaxID=2502783 RepID=UPI000FEB946D|nr:mandelate racemase/muconate lactonizing enzyme family protein [Phycicoccus flavus]NHA66477.1 mandelate racemase/muconate lactonizing enzyme family protein [Phycicoccus flavus]